MTQENPTDPPSTVEDALTQLQAALELERASGAADRSASQKAFAELQRIYKWAEGDRQKLWAFHNGSAKALGMPFPLPGGGHYNIEDLEAFLASRPPQEDVAALKAERDEALAVLNASQASVVSWQNKANAAEARAVKAEEKVSTFATQKTEVTTAIAGVKRTLEAVERKLK